LVHAVPKKWWVESDITAPDLLLSLRFKGSIVARVEYISYFGTVSGWLLFFVLSSMVCYIMVRTS